ncbi:MAG TPA: transporter substrate-binding domain-containing protein, partial [Lysobacter sp.]
MTSLVNAAPLDLTAQERDWLRAHPTITVATYKGGWPPFERYERGTLSGLGPAYLDDVARQLGLRVAVRQYPSWEEAFKAGCRREVDVLMNVSLVPERTPCLVFTASYAEATPVAVGSATRTDLLAPDRLVSARIAVDRGASIERAVRTQFPRAQVITVTSAMEGFEAILHGKADVYFGNPYVARAALATDTWPSLAVLAPVDLPADTLHFAVPDDRKPLASMIDKALARVTAQRQLEYERKWLGTALLPISRAGRVPLTYDEEQWLRRMPPPRVGFARNWEPISFAGDDGRISGIAGEYVRMMQSLLGVTVGTQSAADIERLRDLMRRGEVDLVPMPAGAPIGPEWSLTSAFAHVSDVIVMRASSRPISGLGDVDGKRIVMVGPARAGKVKAAAPAAVLMLVTSIPDAMRAVERGDADAYVGDMISADRPLRRGEYPTLRLAAPAGFEEDLVFAARGEYRPLVPLINRMLDGLSSEEQQRIRSGWLEVQVSSGVKWRTVAIGAALAALLVAILAFAWLRTRTEIRRREKTDGLMRDLTRNLPGVIFKLTRDPAGAYRMPFIAGNTRALFGLEHADIAAAPREALTSLIHPDDGGRMLDAFEESLEQLAPVEMDFRTTSPAPERWVRVSAVARRLDDGLVHWSGYWVDVSAFHRQAQALENARVSAESAASSRANFLAAMSHEIRTPMAGITGIIEILSRSDVNDDQRYLLGLVEDYAQALRTILDDVLDLSRIEAGGLVLEPVETDLRVLVSNSIELVLDLCRRKNLRCVCHIDPDLAGVVTADPTRLRQILLNLLSNAIKFTSAGYVAMSVQVLDSTDDGRQTLSLSVTDSGIGIASSEQENLFQPFTQAQASTSRTHGGSGLGLAICRRLARLMDGSIDLESTPGLGTRVSLTLNVPIVRQSAHDPLLVGRNVFVRCGDADVAEA